MTQNHLITQLQERRRARGVTLDALAMLTGMKAPNISAVLTGKRRPDLATLERLGTALGLRLAWTRGKQVSEPQTDGKPSEGDCAKPIDAVDNPQAVEDSGGSHAIFVDSPRGNP